MSTPAALAQGLVIAALLAWSALFATRRLLPAASRRAQARFAGWLERARPRWLRRAGVALKPVRSERGGCGDGCSSCGACAPAERAPGDAQPLVFHPRSK
ncbi:MAG TPA: DUF6587 family protein [Dokdonella sp.]